MESGITSAQRGRLPLDHGNCSKMEGMWLLVEAFKQVGCTQRICFISIIAQVIIEMLALLLVDECVISYYNHPGRGDCNTEAPRDFLMFLKKKRVK